MKSELLDLTKICHWTHTINQLIALMKSPLCKVYRVDQIDLTSQANRYNLHKSTLTDDMADQELAHGYDPATYNQRIFGLQKFTKRWQVLAIICSHLAYDLTSFICCIHALIYCLDDAFISQNQKHVNYRPVLYQYFFMVNILPTINCKSHSFGQLLQIHTTIVGTDLLQNLCLLISSGFQTVDQ